MLVPVHAKPRENLVVVVEGRRYSLLCFGVKSTQSALVPHMIREELWRRDVADCCEGDVQRSTLPLPEHGGNGVVR